MNRSTVTVRWPSRANRGLIENSDRSDWIGYSISTSISPWLQNSSVSAGRGAPVTCASAASNEPNDLSAGSEARTAAMRAPPSAVSPS